MLMNDYELCYDADFMPEITYIININPIVVSTDIFEVYILFLCYRHCFVGAASSREIHMAVIPAPGYQYRKVTLTIRYIPGHGTTPPGRSAGSYPHPWGILDNIAPDLLCCASALPVWLEAFSEAFHPDNI
jgi:hypothetical protein